MQINLHMDSITAMDKCKFFITINLQEFKNDAHIGFQLLIVKQVGSTFGLW